MPADHDDLVSLHLQVTDFQLCAINTWVGGTSNHKLFGPGEILSLIDLILIRQRHPDSISRTSHSIHDHLLDAGRHSQWVHLPVHASLPFFWLRWSNSQRRLPVSRIDVAALRKDSWTSPSPRLAGCLDSLNKAFPGSLLSVVSQKSIKRSLKPLFLLETDSLVEQKGMPSSSRLCWQKRWTTVGSSSDLLGLEQYQSPCRWKNSKEVLWPLVSMPLAWPLLASSCFHQLAAPQSFSQLHLHLLSEWLLYLTTQPAVLSA